MFRTSGFFPILLMLFVTPALADVAPPVKVTGPQRLLVVAVRFPGTAPEHSLEQIRQKAERINRYIQAASFGRTRIVPRVAGWYDMPEPLPEYRVSPYNYRVDRGRVRKLLADALGAARAGGIDLAAFDQVWIVVGVRTSPGEGYGMIAYCANPGMLSGVRRGAVRHEVVDLAGGGTYAGPAIVSAENAHIGHVAHDLLHALGGVEGGKRVVPDLYDFDLQSNPPREKPMHPALFAIHAGPWGVMSQHFIERQSPPSPPLAFTRLQLGWIGARQVREVKPGETREVTLSPLAAGKGTLAIRIPLGDGRFLLLENRQPVGGDKVLPAHGLVISRVDTAAAEGGGIVRVMDANPSTKDLSDAAYRVGAGERRAFVDGEAGVAVAPLSLEGDGRLRLVVTTPERIAAYIK